MAPGCIEAEHRSCGGSAQRQRGLVPVGAGILHSQRRKDFHLHAADPAEAVFDLALLGREGGFIAHVAAGAAAAAGEHGTVRVFPVR